MTSTKSDRRNTTYVVISLVISVIGLSTSFSAKATSCFGEAFFSEQDDPQDYVDPEVIAEWEKKDPIDLFRARMLRNEWATEEELREIEEAVFEEGREAAEKAVDEPMPHGPDATDDVYTDLVTPHPWTRFDHPDPATA